MNEELRRRLAIGFIDATNEERHRLVKSQKTLKEIQEDHPFNKNDEVEQVLRWLERSSDNRILWYGDKNFPDYTGIEKHVPYMLFVEGEIEDSERISIVGTRKATYNGINASFELGLETGFNGYALVSGMAEGCDQAATLGCLYSDSPCYEVLGCGLEVDYPSMTKNLRKRIKDGKGAIISQFSPQMPPLKQNFPNRNVTIAAMSRITVVVQAPLRSGALYTLDFAMQLGRDIAVSRAGTDETFASRGTRRLSEDGCPVIDHISDCFSKACLCAENSKDGQYRFQDRYYNIKNET